MPGDDFGLLYGSDARRFHHESRSGLGEGPQDARFLAEAKEREEATLLPRNEVAMLDMARNVVAADDHLQRVKGAFAERIAKIKKRAYTVQREQEKLRKSLVKYNNFVREKDAKVEEGEEVYESERAYQATIQQRLQEKKKTVRELEAAKEMISAAVERRDIFRKYLETVVEEERANRNRYRDIGELMKRCETLVVTRDESKQTLRRLENEIVALEDDLIAFKDTQNERILKLSAVQNALQETLYTKQGQRDAKQRVLDQKVKEQINKELSIANIKLRNDFNIRTCFKVILPTDLKKGGQTAAQLRTSRLDKPPADVSKQLVAIKAHIEDLLVVIERVNQSEDADRYLSPMLSEFSEMALVDVPRL